MPKMYDMSHSRRNKKWLAGINDLAYFATASVTKTKSFFFIDTRFWRIADMASVNVEQGLDESGKETRISLITDFYRVQIL